MQTNTDKKDFQVNCAGKSSISSFYSEATKT